VLHVARRIGFIDHGGDEAVHIVDGKAGQRRRIHRQQSAHHRGGVMAKRDQPAIVMGDVAHAGMAIAGE
jgi:hypothetical protein